MNLFDVMHWIGIDMVMGSNFDNSKLNFLFAKISFWHEGERVENTLDEWAAKGGWENIKTPLKDKLGGAKLRWC